MRSLSEYQSIYISELTGYLEKYIDLLYADQKYHEMREIFLYHLGLGDGKMKQGKRLRPFITLLCCSGTGTDWRKALPGAAAIELIHNFSLIHDDIEDNGKIRRGKESVWIKWGLAQGLNAGDAMFVSAFDVIVKLESETTLSIAMTASKLLAKTCGKLTEGQYLDIDFEKRKKVSVNEYLAMIEGKTAALISCCTKIGALIGGLSEDDQEIYSQFGRSLGIAFQIYDDWLGIWGKEKIMGKTSTGDILEKKKTLPIILGIENSERFSREMQAPAIDPQTVSKLANWLSEDGVEQLTIDAFTQWTNNALKYLQMMKCRKEEKKALTNNLLMRKK